MIGMEVLPGIKIVLDWPTRKMPQDGQRIISGIEKVFKESFNSWCRLSFDSFQAKAYEAFVRAALKAFEGGIIPSECEVKFSMYGNLDRVAVYPIDEHGERGPQAGWLMPTKEDAT